MLLLAQEIFPEGQGRPNGRAKLAAVATLTNGLVVGAKAAVAELFKGRGYDPRRPEYTKQQLGYALDQYEAIAIVITRALGYPLLSEEERPRGARSASAAATC